MVTSCLICAEGLSSAVTSLCEHAYWKSQAVALAPNGWSSDADLPSQLQQHLKYLQKMHVLSEASLQTVADCFSGTPVSP